ncbi:MAG: tetratricopeptide repeat protein [Hasllibacter sp.]
MASLAVAALLALPAFAQEGDAPAAAPEAEVADAPREPETLDELFEALRIAPDGQHDRIALRIERAMSRSGSQTIDYLLKRGRDAIEAQDPEAAIDHLSAAIDHAPQFAQPYVERAAAFFAAGRPGLALYDLRRALVLEPRHFDAMIGIGFILADLDEPETALEALRAAQGFHPAIPEVNDMIDSLEAELEGTPL